MKKKLILHKKTTQRLTFSHDLTWAENHGIRQWIRLLLFTSLKTQDEMKIRLGK